MSECLTVSPVQPVTCPPEVVKQSLLQGKKKVFLSEFYPDFPAFIWRRRKPRDVTRRIYNRPSLERWLPASVPEIQAVHWIRLTRLQTWVK